MIRLLPHLLYVLTFLPCMALAECRSEQRTFLVLKGNEHLGTLTTWQRVENSRVTYCLQSEVQVDFLFTIRVNELMTDVFENGVLSRSSHMRLVNESLKASNTLVRREGTSTIVDQRGKITHLTKPVLSSMLSLYFHEPKAGQWVYSQNFRQLVQLRKLKDHTYFMELPNGGTACFTYHEGMLVMVESKTNVGVIKFVYQN